MKQLIGFLLLLSVSFAQTPSLSVNSQSSNGYAINLNEVTLAQDGFVVVHATNDDGSLIITPDLGNIFLEAGSHTNVSIELNPGLLAEYGYADAPKDVAPMLHIDDGNGVYEFPAGPDGPVVVEGEVVVSKLELSLSEALKTLDQTLASNTLTIDSVTMKQDGFVVVHALDQNGDMVVTPELGKTFVKAGIQRFIKIALDPDRLTEYGYDGISKTVVPMLHIDDGNGEYEFPEGPDLPVIVEGGPLVSPLTLSQPSGEARIDFADATTVDVSSTGISMTLPSVTMAQDGFVVIHAANEDGSMRVLPILGVTDLLTAGIHEDIRIAFSEEIPAVGDTVFAMLHIDDGDGVYRFPESDGPFIIDGAPFIVPVELQ